MKKVLALVLAIAMTFALCACGSASFTSTTTTTTTDANGNTTTTTTTNSQSIGDTTVTCESAAADGESHTASLNITNSTSLDIEQLYIALPEDTSWGDNALETPIKAGEDVSDRDFTMTYDKDCLLWQIAVVDSEGNEHDFEWELNDCDSEALNLEFTTTTDGWLVNFW